MNLGFDFNMVIADCQTLKNAVVSIIKKKVITSSEYKADATEEEIQELNKMLYETPEIGKLMIPINGVLEYLPKLYDWHNIRIVTSRGMYSEIPKMWLKLFGLPDIEVFGVNENGNKLPYVVGLDMFVDDKLDNLEQMLGCGIPYLFLFTSEKNRHEAIPKGIWRIDSWGNIYGVIKAISKYGAQGLLDYHDQQQ